MALRNPRSSHLTLINSSLSHLLRHHSPLSSAAAATTTTIALLRHFRAGRHGFEAETPSNWGSLVVPQQSAYVVERLGRLHKTLESGVPFLIPIVDKVTYIPSLKEFIHISDQFAISTNGIVCVRIVDPMLTSYEVSNAIRAVKELLQTTMRSKISKKNVVNLEYLGRAVFNIGGMLYPDSVVGTDSHTTMIDGLGVAGWGVGGIEAEAVMLGQLMSMVLLEVVGFKLSGKLKNGVTATDLVMAVTLMLRKHGLVGKFVEFYGEGMNKLSLADRAAIANMSPGYGATMGFFPVDHVTLQYLKLTGRSDETVAMMESYLQANKMFVDYNQPQTERVYSSCLQLDLEDVEPCLSGPKRPHDRVLLKEMKADWHSCLDNKVGFKSIPSPGAQSPLIVPRRYGMMVGRLGFRYRPLMVRGASRCFSSPSSDSTPPSSDPATTLPSSGGKREILVDTYALVERLKAQGMPQEHAGVVVSIVMEIVSDSFERGSKLYTFKCETEKIQMTLESSQNLEIQEIRAELRDLRGELHLMIQRLRLGTTRYALGFLASICTFIFVACPLFSYFYFF